MTLHEKPCPYVGIQKRPAWGGRPFQLEEAVSKRKEGIPEFATGMPKKGRAISQANIMNLQNKILFPKSGL
jgi:hypothetical protein